MAVALSGLFKFDQKKTSRVRQCSDLIAASNSRPLGSLSTNGSTTAKSGDRSRTISMQVFASRQVATTAKSLSADKMLFKPHRTDPPPMKWSDLRYVFDIKEDCNGKEALQARRDRREVAAGRCSGFARPIHGGRNPSDRRERSDLLPVATGVRRVAD